MGMTQREAALLLEVALNTWARWERGELGVHPERARQLCRLRGLVQQYGQGAMWGLGVDGLRDVLNGATVPEALAARGLDARVIGRIRMLVRRARRIPLWQSYLAVGALGTALYALVPPFAGSGPLINGLGLSGVVAIIVGVRRNRPASNGPWRFFAVGLFLFWVGDLYTYSYPRLFHVSVPFPSIGDAIYLTVYPALMMGLLLLVRRRNPGTDRAGVIDSLIMTLGLSLVSFMVLIAPYVHDNTLSLVPKLVSVAYPLGDILLLAAAIRLAVDTGKRRPAFYMLASSIATLLVTDFVYGLLTLHNAYTHQLILDVGWILFYLL